LKDALAQQCHKVSLHTILIGETGTIYKCHSELPLNKLGLDRCRVRKLTLDLNTHNIQHATKIQVGGRKLSRKEHMALSEPSRPPLIKLPRLMVEVILVLAPDPNFFLNSHKQGLPL